MAECHGSTNASEQCLAHSQTKIFAGPFDNTAHMAALLDRTTNRGLRHCLLRLMEALLTPRAAHISDQAAQAARLNATAFVEAGGVVLAVDLVAGENLQAKFALRVSKHNVAMPLISKPSMQEISQGLKFLSPTAGA